MQLRKPGHVAAGTQNALDVASSNGITVGDEHDRCAPRRLLGGARFPAETVTIEEHHEAGRFPQALEALGRALYWQLLGFPGARGITVGAKPPKAP